MFRSDFVEVQGLDMFLHPGTVTMGRAKVVV